MSPTLMSGTAAEHLVCADLLLSGYKAFLATQVCSYDVVAEIGDRLYKIQVKSVKNVRPNGGRRQTSPVYQWSIRKRNRASYVHGDFDLVALVALDTRQIAYVSRDATSTLSCVCIRADGNKVGASGQKGRLFSEYPLAYAITGQSKMEILKRSHGQSFIS